MRDTTEWYTTSHTTLKRRASATDRRRAGPLVGRDRSGHHRAALAHPSVSCYRSATCRIPPQETLAWQRTLGAPAWSVERAVHADGERVTFSHDVIATAVLPAPTADRSGTIDLSREQLGNGSVFAELEARGLLMVRSLAEIHAVAANDVTWSRDESATTLYLLLDQLHRQARRADPVQPHIFRRGQVPVRHPAHPLIPGSWVCRDGCAATDGRLDEARSGRGELGEGGDCLLDEVFG